MSYPKQDEQVNLSHSFARFWQQQLEAANPPATLPSGNRSPVLSGQTARVAFPLPAWEGFLQVQQLSAMAVLLGAWALLLHRYHGSPDGVVVAMATEAGLLPLSLAVAEETAVADWLKQAAAQYAACLTHQAPLHDIQTWTGLPEDWFTFSGAVQVESTLPTLALPLLVSLQDEAIHVVYDVAWMTETAVAHLVGHLQTILTNIVNHPHSPLCRHRAADG
ncbi:MAG: hypothetical protein H6660_10660 [Ardenticatenaceae bacterium]|nr:hypothetical protein [Ardenticatenaceae bacterium]